MYTVDQKIRWELLSPSLQTKFKEAGAYSETANKELKKMESYAEQSIKDAISKTNDNITTLKDLTTAKVTEFTTKVDKLISGEGDDGPQGGGIFYAYETGSYGQNLKVDKDNSRIIAADMCVKLALCRNSDESTKKKPELVSYVYNTESDNLYHYESNEWVLKNQHKTRVLTRSFIEDSTTSKMYYFWTPTVYTRVR